jgi:pilus assembly protein Flp/PilA
MSQLVTRFLKDQSGATAIEYGLIITLIALMTVGAFGVLGGHVTDVFQTAADQVAGS